MCVCVAVAMGCCLYTLNCVPVSVSLSVGVCASPLFTVITSKHPRECVYVAGVMLPSPGRDAPEGLRQLV